VKCSDIMNKAVQTIDPEDSVLGAARKMEQTGVGFLPVCDAAGKPLGAITDRDIVLRVVARERQLTTRVFDAMSHDVVACRPDADLREAEVIMVREQKSRIMCLSDDGVLVGVISLSDIAACETARRAAKTLHGVTRRETRP
jgi:CBS domain-containing protein